MIRDIALLREILGDKNVFIDEDMSKHTSFKTGGKADVFIKIDRAENIKFILNFSKENKIPLFILGNGSNLLVRDKGFRGIICKIEIDKFEIIEKGEDVFVKIRCWK